MNLTSRFAFVLCQPGAEPALKRELSMLRPGWASAYQRPGLVTFRGDQDITPELCLRSVFARAYGCSLGNVPAGDVPAVVDVAASLAEPPCLHVVERAPADPDASESSEPLRALRSELLASRSFAANERAHGGQLVLTVVVGDDPNWLLGLHRHDQEHVAYPGGRIPIALPAASPSRAYLKIEEAIARFRLPVRAGDQALEIGAAPGGAAYALMQRGLNVLAVDPAEMDPALLGAQGPGGARVRHLAVAVGELERSALPARVDWLLLDVHLAPQVALRAARRVASLCRNTLLGAVLTLKLNDWRFAERLPSFLAQSRELGLLEPRACQLVSHRQELAIVGLTARGVRRV